MLDSKFKIGYLHSGNRIPSALLFLYIYAHVYTQTYMDIVIHTHKCFERKQTFQGRKGIIISVNNHMDKFKRLES